ncbi:MAG TPA: hypothetical protein VGX50_11625 [Longimicrobium sp.]|jgi:hypothetical protein|nr:hypothetical protein [Longimicrobium sp.]
MQHDRKHNLNAEEARASGEDHSAQHDRRHDLNAEEAGGASSEDHSGERDVNLSAKSLAARGDAPDGSEDGSGKA